MRYDAFISYNHRADQSLAPALQDALQHLVATAGANAHVQIWDLAHHQRSSFLDRSGPPLELVFSPDGRKLALVHEQATVVLRDLASGRDTLVGDGAATVRTVAFSPDGARVAASDVTGQVSSNEDGAAPTHQSAEIQVFDAFAYLASPARLVEQVCHELRGYEPDPTAWHTEVPYLRYAEVCP